MPFRNILVIIPDSEDWKDAWRNLANQVPKKFLFTNLCSEHEDGKCILEFDYSGSGSDRADLW